MHEWNGEIGADIGVESTSIAVIFAARFNQDGLIDPIDGLIDRLIHQSNEIKSNERTNE